MAEGEVEALGSQVIITEATVPVEAMTMVAGAGEAEIVEEDTATVEAEIVEEDTATVEAKIVEGWRSISLATQHTNNF